MQFDATKTLLALVLVFGTYVGIYLASPAPPYAVTISVVLFLVFGTVIWYLGVRYGEFRAKRLASGRNSGRDKPERDSSK